VPRPADQQQCNREQAPLQEHPGGTRTSRETHIPRSGSCAAAPVRSRKRRCRGRARVQLEALQGRVLNREPRGAASERCPSLPHTAANSEPAVPVPRAGAQVAAGDITNYISFTALLDGAQRHLDDLTNIDENVRAEARGILDKLRSAGVNVATSAMGSGGGGRHRRASSPNCSGSTRSRPVQPGCGVKLRGSGCRQSAPGCPLCDRRSVRTAIPGTAKESEQPAFYRAHKPKITCIRWVR
jgi:hypothetical protein